MRVHNNEIILSWLRTEDSYYADEDWHIHQTDTKFDENGHWVECECGYKSEVCVHALSAWNTIPENNGEKDVVTRSCPCGYEESKDAPAADSTLSSNTGAIILICCSSAIVVAAVVAMIVIVKKKKTQK